MALVSMVTKDTDNAAVSCSENKYGYGLTIYLNSEQCKNLGITNPIKAGTTVNLIAYAYVTQISESVSDKDGDESNNNELSITLQITDLGLTTALKAAKPSDLYKDLS